MNNNSYKLVCLFFYQNLSILGIHFELSSWFGQRNDGGERIRICKSKLSMKKKEDSMEKLQLQREECRQRLPPWRIKYIYLVFVRSGLTPLQQEILDTGSRANQSATQQRSSGYTSRATAFNYSAFSNVLKILFDFLYSNFSSFDKSKFFKKQMITEKMNHSVLLIVKKMINNENCYNHWYLNVREVLCPIIIIFLF